MDCARIFGIFQHARRAIRGKPGPSGAARLDPGARRRDDFALMPRRRESSETSEQRRPGLFCKVLALLAPLVPTSLFNFLFRRTGQKRPGLRCSEVTELSLD